jgi:hypothetical protein
VEAGHVRLGNQSVQSSHGLAVMGVALHRNGDTHTLLRGNLQSGKSGSKVGWAL